MRPGSEEIVAVAPPFPRVVVCIPAFNEEKTIGSVVRSACRFANYVIVCDDGSADKTSSEAVKGGGLLVKHPKNLGKGAALRTLIQEASRFDPDILVTLDGDGQHDPSEVPLLVGPILERTAEVVIGSRFNNGNRIPLYRSVGNSILTALTNFSAKTKVRDTQSGFRAYSSNVIQHLAINGNGIGVDSELLVRVAEGGFRVTERDVTVSYEGNTPTFHPISHTLRVLLAILRVHFGTHLARTFRIRLLLVLSFTTAAFLLIQQVLSFQFARLAPYVLGIGTAGLGASLALNGRISRWIRKPR